MNLEIPIQASLTRYLQILWIRLWSRGDLLLGSFDQLSVFELGSSSYQRHQVRAV